MKRVIIVSIVIFLILAAGTGLYYLNEVYLPTFVREKISSELSGITLGRVKIETIRLNIFRGVILSDVTLYDKDVPEKKLCAAKEVLATFLFIPFLKERRIIIPTLAIHSCNIDLLRQKDNTFNLSYILNNLQKTGGTKTPPLLIKNIRFTDSRAHFTDTTFDPPVPITIKIARLSTDLGWTKASLIAEGEIIRDLESTRFLTQGNYSYNDQTIDASLAAEKLTLKTLAGYLKNASLNLEKGELKNIRVDYHKDRTNTTIKARASLEGLNVKQGEFSLDSIKGVGTCFLKAPANNFNQSDYRGALSIDEALFAFKGDTNAEGKIEKSTCDYTVENNTINLIVAMNISGVTAQKDALKLSEGSIGTQAKITLPIVPQENTAIAYEGNATIKSADIVGLERIGKVSAITSSLSFKTGELLINDANMTLLDAPVKAKGNFRKNILTLDIAGDFDLEKIREILPKEIQLPFFEISGTTDAKIHTMTDIAAKTPPAISGEATLENVDFVLTENNLKFETEAGRVKFDIPTESLEWHFETLKFRDTDYTFDGKLKNFSSPAVDAYVASKDLEVHAALVKLEDKLRIDACEGRYKNSDFDLKGVYNPGAQTTALSVNSHLDLADIPNTDFKGKCLVSAETSGSLKDYRLWNIKAKATSDAVRAYGYSAQKVALDYVQIKETGFLNSLTFNAYNGKALIQGRVKPFEKNPAYTARGTLQDIDLSALKADMPMEDKTLSGILSLKFNLQGLGRDPKNLNGEATFAIKDGDIWEFNPLKGLGNFLFAPRFKNIIFTCAQGDLDIAQGYVATENLELLGPGLGLIIEGKISFEGDLDFLINSQVPLSAAPSQETTSQEDDQAGIVISKAGSLTAIKVTGTVKEPKYKLQPIGENIMKKLGDIVSNILP